jgi:hypothetical protein
MEIWSESRRGSSDRGTRSLWVALTLCVLRDDWLGTCSASLTVRVAVLRVACDHGGSNPKCQRGSVRGGYDLLIPVGV